MRHKSVNKLSKIITEQCCDEQRLFRRVDHHTLHHHVTVDCASTGGWLFVDVECVRVTCSLVTTHWVVICRRGMRQGYLQLYNLNHDLINSYHMRCNNHQKLLDCLKKVNQLIQQAGQLRCEQCLHL